LVGLMLESIPQRIVTDLKSGVGKLNIELLYILNASRRSF
jgi:hypothetical protein